MFMLEQVIAFALLMIVLSTVASGFTEATIRLTALRKRNLRGMVRKFLSIAVWPSYDASSKGLDASKFEAAHGCCVKALRDHLTYNSVSSVPKGNKGFFYYWYTQHWLDELSTPAFLERLAKTRVGKKFYELDEDYRRSLIIDLSLSYERYIAAAQELYRKTSQKVAFGVAIGLAVFGNVHLTRLVEYLGNNPAAVRAIVDNQDEILAMQEAIEEADGEIDDEIQETLKQLVELGSELGIPIGWNYWPYNELRYRSEDPTEDDGSGGDETGAEEADSGAVDAGQAGGDETAVDTNGDQTDGAAKPDEGWLIWFLNCLAAGVLIGLGAPFWYRLTKGIGQARAFSAGIDDNESVGTSPIVHDESAMERAGGNYNLFMASAEAAWAKP